MLIVLSDFVAVTAVSRFLFLLWCSFVLVMLILMYQVPCASMLVLFSSRAVHGSLPNPRIGAGGFRKCPTDRVRLFSFFFFFFFLSSGGW